MTLKTRILLPFLALWWIRSCQAQTIESLTSRSTDGRYTITQIGRPSPVRKLVGGRYILTGGFTGIVLIQTPNAPALSITLDGQSALLSWEVDGQGDFILEEASTLTSPTIWNRSGATVTVSGKVSSASVSATSRKFYRLRRP